MGLFLVIGGAIGRASLLTKRFALWRVRRHIASAQWWGVVAHRLALRLGA